MKVKKYLFLVLGCIGTALGAAGAVLPLLPAFPFLLFAAFCFAKSSQRLHNWFIQTKLYKKNLESFVHGKGMALKTKFRIIGIVTLTMLAGFIMMSQVPVGRIILAAVWVFHIIYFIFGVKTIKPDSEFPFYKDVQIEGMHCKACAKKLECALNQDTHICADVNFEKKTASIKTKNEIDKEKVYEIIQQAGYRMKS